MHQVIGGAAAAVFLGAIALPATAATFTIPDPSPSAFNFYGTGDASVAFDGVTFTQSSTLGNASLFDVGHLFSGDRAVLSSQEESEGVANILISFAGPLTDLEFDYGTFNGSPVTFALSNGHSFTQASTGSGYVVSNLFHVDESTPFTSVLVTSSDFVLNVAGVPEPATWAMMLFGVGMIGAGLRIAGRKDGMALTAA
jgi:hypothetical protein